MSIPTVVTQAKWTSAGAGIFIGLAYHQGKDIIVFRFIIEYSSLIEFGPQVVELYL